MPTVTSHNKAEFDRQELEKRGLLESSEPQVKEEKPREIGDDLYAHNAKVGKSTLLYNLNHKEKELELHSLRTPLNHRGQGHGNKAMEWLNSKADELGYKSKLAASPLDKKTKLNKLVDFYKSHGYELTGKAFNQAGEPEMIRHPKSEEK